MLDFTEVIFARKYMQDLRGANPSTFNRLCKLERLVGSRQDWFRKTIPAMKEMSFIPITMLIGSPTLPFVH